MTSDSRDLKQEYVSFRELSFPAWNDLEGTVEAKRVLRSLRSYVEHINGLVSSLVNGYRYISPHLFIAPIEFQSLFESVMSHHEDLSSAERHGQQYIVQFVSLLDAAFSYSQRQDPDSFPLRKALFEAYLKYRQIPIPDLSNVDQLEAIMIWNELTDLDGQIVLAANQIISGERAKPSLPDRSAFVNLNLRLDECFVSSNAQIRQSIQPLQEHLQLLRELYEALSEYIDSTTQSRI